jgi:hypothetical protein
MRSFRGRSGLYALACAVAVAGRLVASCSSSESIEAARSSDGGGEASTIYRPPGGCAGCAAAPHCLEDGGAPPAEAYECVCYCGGAGPVEGGAFVCTALACLEFRPDGVDLDAGGDASDARDD